LGQRQYRIYGLERGIPVKILVTGGTGFIGNHLVRRLSETDHQVTCLVRKNSDTSTLERLRVAYIAGDVTDSASLRTATRGHDWVINLANVYSFWESDPRVYRRVNVDGTKNVMESALEAGVSKVVHISTGGIYGKPKDAPFTEESEVGPVRFSEYFQTKYEGDQIAWQLYRNKKLPLVMVYPMAVLGPNDPKTTGQYIRRILQRRLPARVLEDSIFTFVHVQDVAEIIYRAATKANNVGEKYLAGKFQHTFGEINRMVSEISGVRLPLFSLPRFTVIPNAWLLTKIADIIKRPPIWGMALDQIRVMKEGVRADGSKAERELAIEYTPIRKAVEEAVASYQDH
jgi:dihydroflavonol-4-reductase